MSKIDRVIFDFDGCIGSSGDAICQLYNLMYHDHPDFEDAKFENCKQYDMTDVCPLLNAERIEKLFASSDFWDYFVMFDGIKELIDELYNDGYDILFASRGTSNNIRHKTRYLTKHFPYATQIPLIGKWDKKISKSMINMENSIFIDDSVDNLFDSDATEKILFNEHGNFNLEWNKGWGEASASTINELRMHIYLILERYKYDHNY